MGLPKINYALTSSNYLDTGSASKQMKAANENLLLANAACSGKYGTLSAGVGVDLRSKYYNSEAEKDTERTYIPAAEVKYKSPSLNVGDNLSFNGQLRGRGFWGDAIQGRATFVANYNLNSQNSIYAAGHLTTKGFGESWKTTTGGWIGYTHKFNNGISVSAEIQQNIPINSLSTPNNQTSASTGETLSDWGDGNKMFNVMVNVPLDKLF